ncbi:MAG: type III secretion system chaperone [Verrucomicrobia bacterium]|nr:type III secretion system chaperone [Verrucomicrobiota bacterium]
MSLEHFQQLIKKFGEQIGVPNLETHPQGLCSLRFDDRVTIDLEYHEENDALLLSSLVGVLKAQESKQFYDELLEANLLWGGTSGATIGVDPASLAVFLCYQEHLKGISLEKFQQSIKKFSDTALFWNQRLAEGPREKEKKESKPA